ncbi:MAG: hypothetical protein NT029_12680 [Armatimonadetes bacterium]|nr:hypothetical protein [Armatimonadota bacterium]
MTPLLLAPALLCSLPLASPPAAADAEMKAGLRRAADQILLHQTPDGALAMSPASAATNAVVPYFANGAAIGLADAYRVTRDARYLNAARRWAGWYEAHMNADGTVYDYDGSPQTWASTGKYDSTDSYASTYMELIAALHAARRDPAWLKARAPHLRRAMSAIRLTLDPRGLTRAHPKWEWMYCMDNVEVARGLHALAATAPAIPDAALAKEASDLRSGILKAIDRELWNEPMGGYRVGVMPNGAVSEGLTKWYPDHMANLMAIAWLPTSKRNAELYGRLKAAAAPPATVTTMDDLDRAVWWLWAAYPVGDGATRRTLESALARLDADLLSRSTVGYPGHVCRLLAAGVSR